MAQHAGRVVGRAGQQWMRRAAFELTDTAAQRLRNLIAQKEPPPLGVRVSLRNRGCNGMSYTLKYVSESPEDLQKVKLDERVSDKGVTIFIDPRALLNVAGTEMDFVDTELASEFVFRNPNVKGTCGCGESFSVK
ncbi:Iron-sulfur cluster assembly 1-like, mitochondrial [Porphyridium purpureum]|uniref:Iron-sulfur cluster assembly 1-like, mitochondrial n=1 Tax=Porphyridium purpureum TaxID=35688 RepID=A0A5J4YIX9_PORPP|nr:Iron-sulfur cluster assembly 1-like, mitochondrial [Porphyridium purpureum]|eukprot:POR5152..scf261_15